MEDGHTEERFMKNLCEIKVGDKVVYSKLFQPDKVLKVTGVTKTLIICGTTRFNKRTGKITGETNGIPLPFITQKMVK